MNHTQTQKKDNTFFRSSHKTEAKSANKQGYKKCIKYPRKQKEKLKIIACYEMARIGSE